MIVNTNANVNKNTNRNTNTNTNRNKNTNIYKLLKRIMTKTAIHHSSHSSDHDKDDKHSRELLSIFKEKLTEEEQLYVVKTLFDLINSKDSIADIDNVLQSNNSRLVRFVFFFFLLELGMSLVLKLFKVNI